jgi:hypothetical protein
VLFFAQYWSALGKINVLKKIGFVTLEVFEVILPNPRTLGGKIKLKYSFGTKLHMMHISI